MIIRRKMLLVLCYRPNEMEISNIVTKLRNNIKATTYVQLELYTLDCTAAHIQYLVSDVWDSIATVNHHQPMLTVG